VTTPFAEKTKVFADTFLSFQIFFISRAKLSHFLIFRPSVLGRLWVKGTAVSITKCCSNIHVDERCIRSLDTYRFSRYYRSVRI